MTLTFDLRPWKLLQQWPLTLLIFVPSFIEICPLRRDTTSSRTGVNGRTMHGWTAAVAALHQGTPGQMTWLDLAGRSTTLAPPCLLLWFALVIVWTENKNFTIFDRWPLYFFLFWQWNNLSGVGGLCVLRATTKKGRQTNFFEEKMHLGDLARGCSDLVMTWFLCCAGAATGRQT